MELGSAPPSVRERYRHGSTRRSSRPGDQRRPAGVRACSKSPRAVGSVVSSGVRIEITQATNCSNNVVVALFGELEQGCLRKGSDGIFNPREDAVEILIPDAFRQPRDLPWLPHRAPAPSPARSPGAARTAYSFGAVLLPVLRQSSDPPPPAGFSADSSTKPGAENTGPPSSASTNPVSSKACSPIGILVLDLVFTELGVSVGMLHDSS